MQVTIDTNNQRDMDFLTMFAQHIASTNGNGTGEAVVQAAKKTRVKKTPVSGGTEFAAEPEPLVEDVPVVDEPEAIITELAGATMDDAVKIATDLVANGKAAEVKAALAQFDVDRVSKLDPSSIPGFIAALS